MTIQALTPEDWPAVRRIYDEGIATGHATFQTIAPAWEEWDAGHLAVCRIVAVTEAGISGWAALSPVSKRPVYSGVAEVSIYVAAHSRGKGLGHALMSSLVAESEREGFWTLQAGIFPENAASVSLHQKHGFRVVGIREKAGCMDGTWRDVVLMERRSTVVGV